MSARNPNIENTTKPANIDVPELKIPIKIASRMVLFLKLLYEHRAN